ncbi:MAG: hypothetical protein LBO04_00780 [Spirochaetaceae bacterium]|jgi:hypothetical protein|nr:hypothetical protein [Spirochaetaceae bacterium]
MFRETISKAVRQENLIHGIIYALIDTITGGKVSEIQNTAFFTAVAAKGFTMDGAAATARNRPFMRRNSFGQFIRKSGLIPRRTFGSRLPCGGSSSCRVREAQYDS